MVRMTMICSPLSERYGNKQQKTIASKRHVRAPLSLRTVNQLQSHVDLVEKYVQLQGMNLRFFLNIKMWCICDIGTWFYAFIKLSSVETNFREKFSKICIQRWG